MKAPHRFVGAAIVVASFLLVRDSRADDERAASAHVEKTWYGWQPLSADAIALTGFVIAGETTPNGGRPTLYLLNPPWAVAGATVFYLGGPTIHLLHGHVLRAAGDLALRTVMTAPALVLFSIRANESVQPGVDGGASKSIYLAFGGFVAALGAAGAVAIDATIMSREEKPRVVERPTTFSIAPDVESLRRGATLGVRGTF